MDTPLITRSSSLWTPCRSLVLSRFEYASAVMGLMLISVATTGVTILHALSVLPYGIERRS